MEYTFSRGYAQNPRFGCDFHRDSTDSDGEFVPLVDEYRIHPHYDLALVYVAPDASTAFESLTLSATAPEPTVGAKIGVVGHPSFNSTLDLFPKYFGFGDQFSVKRFSPGTIRAIENRCWKNHTVEVFLHDATTLSGSSGSCILELSTLKVVGLHFGGWPKHQQLVPTPEGDTLAELFHANGAVPLWTLTADPFLSEVAFG